MIKKFEKGEKSAIVRSLIASNKGRSTSEIKELLPAGFSVSSSFLHKLVADANKAKPGKVLEQVKAPGMNVLLTVPKSGLTIKLVDDRGRLVGTMAVTQEGFSYVKPNGQVNKRAMLWVVRAATLVDSGLL